MSSPWQDKTGIFQGVNYDQGNVAIVVVQNNQTFVRRANYANTTLTVAELQRELEATLETMQAIARNISPILYALSQQCFDVCNGDITIKMKVANFREVRWEWTGKSTDKSGEASYPFSANLLDFLDQNGLNAAGLHLIEEATLLQIRAEQSVEGRQWNNAVVEFIKTLPLFDKTIW